MTEVQRPLEAAKYTLPLIPHPIVPDFSVPGFKVVYLQTRLHAKLNSDP